VTYLLFEFQTRGVLWYSKPSGPECAIENTPVKSFCQFIDTLRRYSWRNVQTYSIRENVQRKLWVRHYIDASRTSATVTYSIHGVVEVGKPVNCVGRRSQMHECAPTKSLKYCGMRMTKRWFLKNFTSSTNICFIYFCFVKMHSAYWQKQLAASSKCTLFKLTDLENWYS